MERAKSVTPEVQNAPALRPIHQDLLREIRKSPGLTVAVLAARCSLPRASVNRLITELRKAGMVEPACFDQNSFKYARIYALESPCPATADVDSPESALPTFGSTESITGEMPADPGSITTSAPVAPAESSEPQTDVSPLDCATAKPVYPSDESPKNSPMATHSPTDIVVVSRGELAALEAAKELAEENARLRLIVESTQKELNRTRALLKVARHETNTAEDSLAEISWICTATGFSGSGDVVDQFEWLLGYLGHGWLASAMRSRRQIQGEIRRQEELLRGLVASVRLGLEPIPQTGDRCLCGRKATKGENDEGFTVCNKCFAEEGEE